MNAFCNEAPRQTALPDGREIFGIPFIHIQQQGGVKNALFYSPSKMSVGGLSVFEAPLVGQILYLVKIQENFAASRRRCEKAQAEFPPPLFISIFFTNTHFCKNYGIMV